ncbi:MAG TPA: GNAT family N-acetyltransferase [Ilumatobacter sp.]|nr:GNAT family N-acetyltransferase [Ilumatobacter sp.]
MTGAPGVTVVEVRPDDERVTPVIAVHVASMDSDTDTPPEACHRLDLAGLLDPSITFFAAFDRDGGDGSSDAIGIGAFAHRAPDWGEVKSMHVLATHRGRGISRLILDAIEATARGKGVSALRLETSRAFTSAIALYERSGYRPCPAFGGYVDHPISLFMEKVVAEAAPADSIPSGS